MGLKGGSMMCMLDIDDDHTSKWPFILARSQT